MNLVAITGNLGRAIELRYTTSGMAVAQFSLAVSRGKNKDGEYETDWINCVAFGNRAEALAKYTDKGSKLGISGRLQTSSYEKDGRRVYKTDVMVDNFDFLDSKGTNKGSVSKQAEIDDFVPMDESEDDLPF